MPYLDRLSLCLGGACVALLVSLGSGCAQSPPAAAEASATKGPFLYPPSPAAPRVQHLVTLASERDLGPQRSGFAEFVAGKEVKGVALTQPYGTALHEGRLLVADTGAPGLAVFDMVARKLEINPGAGAGRMMRPINVSVDRDGTRYIADAGVDQVLAYDKNNRFLRAIGKAGQFRPTDVAIVGERLYVVDILHHQVQVLEKSTGDVIFTFGKAGSAAGELFHPTNIAVGPDGHLYVTETGNFRVQRFTPDGKHVRFYGEAGNLPGTFARPKGLAVDKAGRVYVGDAAFQNVQIFESNGRLLMDFGQPMPGLDGLNLPAAVRIDYENLAHFKRYADPRFTLEHLILVVSQFGPNKVDVYGFGRMAGVDYESPGAGGKR